VVIPAHRGAYGCLKIWVTGQGLLNGSSPFGSGTNFTLPKGDSGDLFQIQL
jgi:hypothetical protein